MLYFDRIEVSEGLTLLEQVHQKKRDICQYCHFLNVLSFKQMSALRSMIC